MHDVHARAASSPGGLRGRLTDVSRAIDWIGGHCDETLRVEELAVPRLVPIIDVRISNVVEVQQTSAAATIVPIRRCNENPESCRDAGCTSPGICWHDMPRRTQTWSLAVHRIPGPQWPKIWTPTRWTDVNTEIGTEPRRVGDISKPHHSARGTANGVHQCPGRDMITIRKEIVRNGRYSAGHDRDRSGLAGA